jgi:hypothetical protein
VSRGSVLRTARPTLATASVIACLALAGVGRPVPATLALLTDSETVASTFSTETLDPPTGLSAPSPALVVNLSWTATVDTRATGYQVLRGTASGGPYSQIATVTPRTAATYADSPLVPGVYYYVVRTFFGSWTSVNSNQVSVLAL